MWTVTFTPQRREEDSHVLLGKAMPTLEKLETVEPPPESEL